MAFWLICEKYVNGAAKIVAVFASRDPHYALQVCCDALVFG